MKVFFRAQGKGITFEEMKNHVSADGGDGLEGAGGVCACLTVTDLLNNTVMDAMDDDDEVDRIRCLGNAVVPQLAEVIGMAIVEVAQMFGETR